MDLFASSLSLTAVSAIWFGYRMYQARLIERHRRLRERITYMLWVMANNANTASD
jgi:hypothetical protein